MRNMISILKNKAVSEGSDVSCRTARWAYIVNTAHYKSRVRPQIRYTNVNRALGRNPMEIA